MLMAAVCPFYDQDYNKNREAMGMAGLRKEDTLGLDFKIQHPEIQHVRVVKVWGDEPDHLRSSPGSTAQKLCDVGQVTYLLRV